MTNKVCPALTNENYDYMLSGDCLSYCTCMLNDRRCIGFDVVDPEDRSSQFFSKGKNILNPTWIVKCPVYGASAETIAAIIKDKSEKILQEKIKNLG
jgi:hypothetical protein